MNMNEKKVKYSFVLPTYNVEKNINIGGNLLSLGTIQGLTLTNGNVLISGGNISGVTNITASGTITGNTLTNGSVTITGGNITGAIGITASGTITLERGIAASLLSSADPSYDRAPYERKAHRADPPEVDSRP